MRKYFRKRYAKEFRTLLVEELSWPVCAPYELYSSDINWQTFKDVINALNRVNERFIK